MVKKHGMLLRIDDVVHRPSLTIKRHFAPAYGKKCQISFPRRKEKSYRVEKWRVLQIFFASCIGLLKKKCLDPFRINEFGVKELKYFET